MRNRYSYLTIPVILHHAHDSHDISALVDSGVCFCGMRFLPDGPQPSAGEECLRKIESRVWDVSHNINNNCSRSVQALKRWQIAASHLFSGVDDTLQSAFVPSSGTSIPSGDGGREYGLDNGGVEVHHYCL